MTLTNWRWISSIFDRSTFFFKSTIIDGEKVLNGVYWFYFQNSIVYSCKCEEHSSKISSGTKTSVNKFNVSYGFQSSPKSRWDSLCFLWDRERCSDGRKWHTWHLLRATRWMEPGLKPVLTLYRLLFSLNIYRRLKTVSKYAEGRQRDV